MVKRSIPLPFVICAFLLGPLGLGPAHSAPGGIDPSFGTDGAVFNALGEGDYETRTTGLKVDREGRTLHLGFRDGGPGLIARRLSDGSADPGFGEAGIVSLPGLVPQSATFDGNQIVIAGLSGSKLMISRLDADGSPDLSFGTNGVATFDWNPPASFVKGAGHSDSPVFDLNDVAVLSSGSVVAAGAVGGCYTSPEARCDQFVAVGTDSAGMSLADFGAAGGVRYFRFYADGVENRPLTAAVAPDGTLRLALYSIADSINGGFDGFINVATLPALSDRPGEWIQDGLPDSAPIARAMVGDLRGGAVFGGLDFDGPGFGEILLQPGGSTIVASGEALVKFTGQGKPDQSFGRHGVAPMTSRAFYASIGNRQLIADTIRVDAEGRIVVSGMSSPQAASSAFVARFTDRGLPDPTFSNDGYVSVWGGSGQLAANPPSLEVRGDRYLVAGTRVARGTPKAVLASVDGGNGQPYTCGGRAATWIGTEADDEVTVLDGVVVTLGGNDRIKFLQRGIQESVTCAGAGDDKIEPLGGTVYGGPGNDRLIGLTAKTGHFLGDTFYGGPGDDILRGKAGADILHGGPGKDLIQGGTGRDEMHGGPGADTMSGGTGTDRMFGGPGRDLMEGGPVGPVVERFTTRNGSSSSVSIVSSGRNVHEILVGASVNCDTMNPECLGPSMDYFRFTSLKFKGKKQLLRGRESFYDDDDWFTFDQKIEARRQGNVIRGRVHYTRPGPWWGTYWTGRSLENPWVPFKARKQPRDRQIVKQ